MNLYANIMHDLLRQSYVFRNEEHTIKISGFSCTTSPSRSILPQCSVPIYDIHAERVHAPDARNKLRLLRQEHRKKLVTSIRLGVASASCSTMHIEFSKI